MTNDVSLVTGSSSRTRNCPLVTVHSPTVAPLT